MTAWAGVPTSLPAGAQSCAAFGLAGEVAVLSVARLAPEKGLDVLLRAATAAGVRPLLVGSGPGVRTSRPSRGTRSSPASFEDCVAEAYAAADIFALLSAHEPWGVAVNEAAASGLPLVLSDRVGAAAFSCEMARTACWCRPGMQPQPPTRFDCSPSIPCCDSTTGALARACFSWGYDPSVEAFVEACREAIASR